MKNRGYVERSDNEFGGSRKEIEGRVTWEEGDE